MINCCVSFKRGKLLRVLFAVTYPHRKGQSSGAKEHGFAVEHFYGDKYGGASIQAGREKDQRYGVPVVGSGNQIFAE
jgi:hypothetical protein